MALEQRIIDVLKEQAEKFNATEARPVYAEVKIPEGENPGRGNKNFGTKCQYYLDITPQATAFRFVPVVMVVHPDEQPFPATVHYSDADDNEATSLTVDEADLAAQVERAITSEVVNRSIDDMLRKVERQR